MPHGEVKYRKYDHRSEGSGELITQSVLIKILNMYLLDLVHWTYIFTNDRVNLGKNLEYNLMNSM